MTTRQSTPLTPLGHRSMLCDCEPCAAVRLHRAEEYGRIVAHARKAAETARAQRAADRAGVVGE